MEERWNALPRFLDTLGYDEEPMGIFYTNEKPTEGFAPSSLDLPTREKEKTQQINWQAVFGDFSCVIGHIWRARKKKRAAFFDAGHFGCPGGAFFLGFMKPQTETIIHYVSTGIPGRMEGEHYCDSPDVLRGIFNDLDPRIAPKSFCVVKPLSQFTDISWQPLSAMTPRWSLPRGAPPAPTSSPGLSNTFPMGNREQCWEDGIPRRGSSSRPMNFL
ncbi:MAG: hypothetical protein H6Q48_3869 [Deltaproteobacteria bacterium]|nr:hypothetical protein [Deltaproteobacteria bacterium]